MPPGFWLQNKENSRRVSVPSGQLYHEVRNLRSGQRYEFWVTASTSVGEGPPSKRAFQTPDIKGTFAIRKLSILFHFLDFYDDFSSVADIFLLKNSRIYYTLNVCVQVHKQYSCFRFADINVSSHQRTRQICQTKLPLLSVKGPTDRQLAAKKTKELVKYLYVDQESAGGSYGGGIGGSGCCRTKPFNESICMVAL